MPQNLLNSNLDYYGFFTRQKLVVLDGHQVGSEVCLFMLYANLLSNILSVKFNCLGRDI